jgi:hypothetical protein
MLWHHATSDVFAVRADERLDAAGVTATLGGR